MYRNRYKYRRKRYYRTPANPLEGFIALFILSAVGYGWTHQKEVQLYGGVALVIAIIGAIVYFIYRRKWRHNRNLASMNEEGILHALKQMSPIEFEQEIANMFRSLGYDTELVGGANDGGIDIVAKKDGQRYFIQCKKFITSVVTPHDVRDFLGAITNINNPATKGFFITTSGFTLMAEKAADGNPRIELVDGIQLVKYYQSAHGKAQRSLSKF